MSVYATQQTAQTIAANAANWTALHTVSNEVADARLADYRREKRIKAIKRYLRERAARKED